MGLHLWRGRLFTPEELESGAPVAVIGHKLAAELTAGRPTESAISTEVTCQGQAVAFIGIQESVVGERPYLNVAVPLSRAEALMAMATTPRARTLALNAARVEDVLAIKTQAEAWADRRNPDWRAKNQITIASTGLDRLVAMNQGILIFKILMGAFTAISLIVGGIGIMNVLLASVASGPRKSACARPRARAGATSSCSSWPSRGDLAGRGGDWRHPGIAGAYLVTYIMRTQTMAQVYAAVTWPTLAVAMGAAILVGLIFGTYRRSRPQPVAGGCDAVRITGIRDSGSGIRTVAFGNRIPRYAHRVRVCLRDPRGPAHSGFPEPADRCEEPEEMAYERVPRDRDTTPPDATQAAPDSPTSPWAATTTPAPKGIGPAPLSGTWGSSRSSSPSARAASATSIAQRTQRSAARWP